MALSGPTSDPLSCPLLHIACLEPGGQPAYSGLPRCQPGDAELVVEDWDTQEELTLALDSTKLFLLHTTVPDLDLPGGWSATERCTEACFVLPRCLPGDAELVEDRDTQEELTLALDSTKPFSALNTCYRPA